MEEKAITLVTGTRVGIGKFLAEHYLNQGHLVIGCSRREPDWNHQNYTHYSADVSDEKTVKRLFAKIRKEHGQLDHLINNAGTASMNHSLLTPISTVTKVLDTNVVGTFLFCREAAKLMKSKSYGRIVNFTTVAVPLKLEGEAIYVASKSAVIGLTEVLAREFAEYGITVNAVGPGPIQTDLIRNVPKDKIESLLSRQAIQQFGTFDDVANVTDFFLNKKSNMITGQCLFLGGV